MEAPIFSSKTPARVSPDDFAAWPPHQQTDFCLMLREMGMKVGDIAAALACHPADIHTAINERFAFRAAVFDTVVGAGNNQKPQRSADTGPTRSGLLILSLMARSPEGKIALSEKALEHAANLRLGTANFGLRSLDHCCLAQRVRAARGNHPAQWQLTEAGWAFAAALAEVSA